MRVLRFRATVQVSNCARHKQRLVLGRLPSSRMRSPGIMRIVLENIVTYLGTSGPCHLSSNQWVHQGVCETSIESFGAATTQHRCIRCANTQHPHKHLHVTNMHHKSCSNTLGPLELLRVAVFCLNMLSCTSPFRTCYTEKATEAWHRQGT